MGIRLTKGACRDTGYYAQLDNAWPDWCSNDSMFKIIYRMAYARRIMGEDVQVDHIVPIMSEIVCGLHVPWNLQIITRLENLRKSNNFWPNQPFENEELFPTTL